jgi:hypothetical protein
VSATANGAPNPLIAKFIITIKTAKPAININTNPSQEGSDIGQAGEPKPNFVAAITADPKRIPIR